MTSFHKALAVSFVVLALSTASGFYFDKASSTPCEHSASVGLDTSLPMSHPVNRCTNQEPNVNWWSWLGGHSTDGQFHFLDLLELLSRMDSHPQATP